MRETMRTGRLLWAAVLLMLGAGNGVAQTATLDRVQEAFIASGGAQCGICTPGMILATISLLERHPRATDDQIRAGLAGNLCRCTGYAGIVRAVQRAADELATA